MVSVEIYFDDLTLTKQEELLTAYGISHPDDANWETFPVATLEVYEEIAEI